MAEAGRLGLILVSGCFDRVHYGLAVASAAAALERPVTLFATLGATRAFVAEGVDGRPGWASLPLSPELVEPGLDDGAGLDERYRARGVAGFEELLQACAGLGVGPDRLRDGPAGARGGQHRVAHRPADPARGSRDPARARRPAARGLICAALPDLHQFALLHDHLAPTARLS